MAPSGAACGHVIDLACGKGITASLAALRYPRARVTAIDILPPAVMPHWSETQRCRVRYMQRDLLEPRLGSVLTELCGGGAVIGGVDSGGGHPAGGSDGANGGGNDGGVDEGGGADDGRGADDGSDEAAGAGRTGVAVLGMHLCGELSLRAIDAFEQCPLAHVLVLSPCCLPKRGSPFAPEALYASRDANEQYFAWSSHLEGTLRALGHAVSRSQNGAILSCKNVLLVATKAAAPAGCAPAGEAEPLAWDENRLLCGGCE
eukprot:5921986-Prymnesium_polylepis.1